MTKNQRKAVMEKFKVGSILLLRATDIASHGYDIPASAAIINFMIWRPLFQFNTTALARAHRDKA